MAGRMINGAAALAELIRPGGDIGDFGSHRVLPVLPELSGLLPSRGLRRGSTIAIGITPGSSVHQGALPTATPPPDGSRDLGDPVPGARRNLPRSAPGPGEARPSRRHGESPGFSRTGDPIREERAHDGLSDDSPDGWPASPGRRAGRGSASDIGDVSGGGGSGGDASDGGGGSSDNSGGAGSESGGGSSTGTGGSGGSRAGSGSGGSSTGTGGSGGSRVGGSGTAGTGSGGSGSGINSGGSAGAGGSGRRGGDGEDGGAVGGALATRGLSAAEGLSSAGGISLAGGGRPSSLTSVPSAGGVGFASSRGMPLTGSGSTSLLLALLAAASSAGSWCAVVGVPTLGALAAAESGIALDRLALVPNPGPEWPTVVAALIDGVDVVVIAVPGQVAASITSRLVARARQRGCVLVPYGRWDGADVTLQVTQGRWEGLGTGHGRLRRRKVTVVARGRGTAARPKEITMWMPGISASSPYGSPPEARARPTAVPSATTSTDDRAAPSSTPATRASTESGPLASVTPILSVAPDPSQSAPASVEAPSPDELDEGASHPGSEPASLERLTRGERSAGSGRSDSDGRSAGAGRLAGSDRSAGGGRLAGRSDSAGRSAGTGRLAGGWSVEGERSVDGGRSAGAGCA
jgi:hypothetical protein